MSEKIVKVEGDIHDHFRVVKVATGEYKIQELNSFRDGEPYRGYSNWNLDDCIFDCLLETVHKMHQMWRFRQGLLKADPKRQEIVRIFNREESTCTELEFEVSIPKADEPELEELCKV